MILTIEDYKKHLPANTVNDASKFAAFELRSIYKYFVKYLGAKLVSDLLSEEADQEIINLLKSPLANFTYLESISFYNLTLTSTGYGVVSNPNIAPASMERVKSLADACLQAANAGLDKLLVHLEESNNTTWNKSSLISGSLIPNSETFSSAIGFHVNKVVFVELVQHIRNYESLVIANALSAEFHQELTESDDSLIRPAFVQALANGAYHHFIANPIFNKQGNIVDVEHKFKIHASKYLNSALDKLRLSLDNYPTYKEYGYESPYDNASGSGMFFIGGLTS